MQGERQTLTLGLLSLLSSACGALVGSFAGSSLASLLLALLVTLLVVVLADGTASAAGRHGTASAAGRHLLWGWAASGPSLVGISPDLDAPAPLPDRPRPGGRGRWAFSRGAARDLAYIAVVLLSASAIFGASFLAVSVLDGPGVRPGGSRTSRHADLVAAQLSGVQEARPRPTQLSPAAAAVATAKAAAERATSEEPHQQQRWPGASPGPTAAPRPFRPFRPSPPSQALPPQPQPQPQHLTFLERSKSLWANSPRVAASVSSLSELVAGLRGPWDGVRGVLSAAATRRTPDSVLALVFLVPFLLTAALLLVACALAAAQVAVVLAHLAIPITFYAAATFAVLSLTALRLALRRQWAEEEAAGRLEAVGGRPAFGEGGRAGESARRPSCVRRWCTIPCLTSRRPTKAGGGGEAEPGSQHASLGAHGAAVFLRPFLPSSGSAPSLLAPLRRPPSPSWEAIVLKVVGGGRLRDVCSVCLEPLSSSSVSSSASSHESASPATATTTTIHLPAPVCICSCTHALHSLCADDWVRHRGGGGGGGGAGRRMAPPAAAAMAAVAAPPAVIGLRHPPRLPRLPRALRQQQQRQRLHQHLQANNDRDRDRVDDGGDDDNDPTRQQQAANEWEQRALEEALHEAATLNPFAALVVLGAPLGPILRRLCQCDRRGARRDAQVRRRREGAFLPQRRPRPVWEVEVEEVEDEDDDAGEEEDAGENVEEEVQGVWGGVEEAGGPEDDDVEGARDFVRTFIRTLCELLVLPCRPRHSAGEGAPVPCPVCRRAETSSLRVSELVILTKGEAREEAGLGGAGDTVAKEKEDGGGRTAAPEHG